MGARLLALASHNAACSKLIKNITIAVLRPEFKTPADLTSHKIYVQDNCHDFKQYFEVWVVYMSSTLNDLRAAFSLISWLVASHIALSINTSTILALDECASVFI